MQLAISNAPQPGAVVFPDTGDPDCAYQRRLALSLINSVGHDGAVRYCRNNAWDGVLRAVLALPRDQGLRRPS